MLTTLWAWQKGTHLEARYTQELQHLQNQSPSPQTFQAPPRLTLSRLILISGLVRTLAFLALFWLLLVTRKLAISLRKSLAQVREGTERIQREHEQARLAAKVFANSSEGICITDPENRILTVNPAFLRMTGYDLEELLGQDPKILSSHRQDPAFYERMWDSLLTSGQWRGEIWDRKKSGEIYPKWMTIDTVKDASGATVNFVAITTDISEQISVQENLRFTAEHDPLTGLPNRLLLNDRFAQDSSRALRDETQIGILFLDLDHFKQVNDTLGHHAGDQLLQQVASRLTSAVRASDTVTRLGGDEFVVMLPDLDSAGQMAPIIQKLQESLSKPYLLAGQERELTVSIGSSCFPDHGDTIAQLVYCADLAMYAAKEGGRNQTRAFSPSMDQADPLP